MRLTNALSHRLIRPKQFVSGPSAVCFFLFKRNGLSYILHLLGNKVWVVADLQENIVCFFESVVLDIPSWGLRAEEKPRNDDDRKEDLKEHDDPPIPFSEPLGVLGACVVDPIREKRSYSKVELPETHDSAPKFGRCYLVDKDRSGRQHQSLAETGDGTTGDVTADNGRCKGRNKR